MLKRLLCLLLALLSPACAAAADLGDTLDSLFRQYKAVGGVVVAARGGEIVFHYNYGWANKKEKLPVTDETYFKTASVSKLVSSLGVMRLVEDGLLDLDAPIGDYLGYPVRNPKHKDTPVTLRQLMSHTSSITGGYTGTAPLQTLLSRAAHWEKWTPGSRYDYSNLGAGVMGSLMEAVTGQDVNTYMQERVWTPLGIDAGYRVPLLDAPEQAALRYKADGTLARRADFYLSEAWDPRALPEQHYGITVGDVWIRGDDLCRIGMMMAGGGELNGVRLLREDTVTLMLSDPKGQPGVTADSPYGLCVERVTSLLPGKTLYGHQGLSDGIVCNLYWDPETQFVFALITNGSSTRMENHICKLSRKAFAAVWDAFGTE